MGQGNSRAILTAANPTAAEKNGLGLDVGLDYLSQLHKPAGRGKTSESCWGPLRLFLSFLPL